MSYEYDRYTLPEPQYKEDTPELKAKREEIDVELDMLAALFRQENAESLKTGQENN